MVRIKRAYQPVSRKDGYRVLVDRLWPRGIRKQNLELDEWLKDLAPSTELRKAFGHDPAKWKSFVSAYKKELRTPAARGLVDKLVRRSAKRTLTLIYGARDEEHNEAVVLKDLIEKESKKSKH